MQAHSCMKWVFLVAMAAASGGLLQACKSNKAAAGVDAGEPCISPGVTETGCTCAAGGFGSRTCQPDKHFNACSCSSLGDGGMCKVGELLKCARCPGASDGRYIKCMAGGVYDCSCHPDAGGTPADAGNTTPHDAGHAVDAASHPAADSGTDSSTGNDAN